MIQFLSLAIMALASDGQSQATFGITPRQASGRPANAEENLPVIAAMCRRWQPVMEELMAAEWPGPTPQINGKKTSSNVTEFTLNDMDWRNAAPAFVKATQRFQPPWRIRHASDFRRPLIKWMRYSLSANQKSSKVSRLMVERAIDKHLARGLIRVWTSTLPVPFFEGDRLHPRYRQVTRVQINSIAGVIPKSVIAHVLLPHSNFYFISPNRLTADYVTEDNAQASYLFLFRGQPYYLTPFTNQVGVFESIPQLYPQQQEKRYYFQTACH
jgi:hypothetical protein